MIKKYIFRFDSMYTRTLTIGVTACTQTAAEEQAQEIAGNLDDFEEDIREKAYLMQDDYISENLAASEGTLVGELHADVEWPEPYSSVRAAEAKELAFDAVNKLLDIYYQRGERADKDADWEEVWRVLDGVLSLAHEARTKAYGRRVL